MTARTGGLLIGPPFGSSTESSRRNYTGKVLTNAVVIGSSPPTYKNQGWYATGGYWESWISTPLPQTSPPSGHLLTEISHVVWEN